MLPASRPRLRRALLPHADRHAAPGSGDVTVGEAQFGLREVAGQRGVRPSAAFLFLPVAPDVEASPEAPSPSGSARDDAREMSSVGATFAVATLTCTVWFGLRAIGAGTKFHVEASCEDVETAPECTPLIGVLASVVRPGRLR
jgi:hypothetical protein